MLIVFALGCGDYEVALPNHYLLARVNEHTLVIVAPNNRVAVQPSVVKYDVIGNAVVGQVRSDDGRDSYFFVDTRQNIVQEGLSSDELHQALVASGIRSIHLREPGRYDSWTHT